MANMRPGGVLPPMKVQLGWVVLFRHAWPCTRNMWPAALGSTLEGQAVGRQGDRGPGSEAGACVASSRAHWRG